MRSTLIAFATLLGVFAQAQDTMKPSLYSRLGGLKGIAAVSDEFVNRLLKEPKIIGNPKVVAAAAHISGPGLKTLLIEQLCSATGGPQKYTGRDMMTAHRGIGVDEDQWQAGAAILKQTLDQFKVPEAEQQEVFGLVGSTKKDIVKDSDAIKSEMADPHPMTAVGAMGSAYSRFGGIHRIANLVDMVVDRSLKEEPVSNDDVVKSAIDAVGIAGLKFVFTEYICARLGGPQGLPASMMELAPFTKRASDASRAATAKHLLEVMEEQKVPQADQNEVMRVASEFVG